MNTQWVFAALLCVVLLGCSKNTASTATDMAKPKVGQRTAASHEVLPADSTPANYIPLQSGRQMVALYWASAKRPVDYGDVAKVLYPNYAAETSEFQRNSMMKTLRPEIDTVVDKAKSVSYLILEPDAGSSWIGEYDAEYKMFPVTPLIGGSTTYSFSDTAGYVLSFNNPRPFSRFKVSDPAVVEKIEKLTKNYALMVNVYVRITGAQPGNNVLEADIQKVELMDKNRNILGVITG